MAILSMKTRKEVIGAQKKAYQKAEKKKKSEIISSLCETTGLSRDRISRILRESEGLKKKVKRETRGRKKKYDNSLLTELQRIWVILDCSCGKRMAAGMKGVLEALIRFDEISADEEAINKLRTISPATIDRLLSAAKQQFIGKGRSTTKPGTLLKKDIPMRTGTDWNENSPGFVEIDLVAHCGDTTAGEYINTLDVTDVCSGWTETQAVINKAQVHVFEGIKDIRTRLPFELYGIDSDNGSEFINHQLFRYCKQEGILFTRSRSYRKNDSCYVEQKNYTIVRRNIGYERYESPDALRLMNEYYALLRLRTNFFMPSLKLESKTRDGARIKKKYYDPKTPCQRLIESEHLDETQKKKLIETYQTINPAEISRKMIAILEKLGKASVPYQEYSSKVARAALSLKPPV